MIFDHLTIIPFPGSSELALLKHRDATAVKTQLASQMDFIGSVQNFGTVHDREYFARERHLNQLESVRLFWNLLRQTASRRS